MWVEVSIVYYSPTLDALADCNTQLRRRKMGFLRISVFYEGIICTNIFFQKNIANYYLQTWCERSYFWFGQNAEKTMFYLHVQTSELSNLFLIAQRKNFQFTHWINMQSPTIISNQRVSIKTGGFFRNQVVHKKVTWKFCAIIRKCLQFCAEKKRQTKWTKESFISLHEGPIVL